MADEAYLAMLNKNIAMEQSHNQITTESQANRPKVETFASSPETSWVAALTGEPTCSIENAPQHHQVISEAKEKLLSASGGLSFYSESDFAFEFFSIPQEFDAMPSPQEFLAAIGKLAATPANVRLLTKPSDEFFSDVLEETDGEEHAGFESFHGEWKALVASTDSESAVIILEDEDSVYVYYFLAIFHRQSKAVFGLATAGVQT